MTNAHCTESDQDGNGPFNDTDEPRKQQSILGFTLAKTNIDTKDIDPYRQGVEIRTPRHRFAGMQPKISSGDECHFTNVVTYGQPASFVKDQGSVKFTDKVNFDTVGFMENPEAFYPIVLNGGPQDLFEGQMEPLTIPFRTNNTTEFSSYTTRGFHGSLESGNASIYPGKGNSIVEQLIEHSQEESAVVFLDEGAEVLGQPTPYPNLEIYNPTKADIVVPLDSLTFSNNNMTMLAYSGIENAILPEEYFLNVESTTHPRIDPVSSSVGPFINSFAVDLTDSEYTASTISTVWNQFFRNNSWSVDFWFLHTGETFFDIQVPLDFTEDDPSEVLFRLERLLINSTGPFVRVTVQSHYHTSYPNNDNSSANVLDDFNIVLGGWNHFAVTYTSSTATIYLNGIQYATFALSTSVPTAIPDPSDNFMIIDEGSATNTKLYSVCFHSKALTQSEISKITELRSKLRAYILFDYSNAISTDGFVSAHEAKLKAYDDTSGEFLIKQLQGLDSEFLKALRALNYNLDEDVRKSYNKKSASAGSSVYGTNAAIYGTDSIAFSNLLRGS